MRIKSCLRSGRWKNPCPLRIGREKRMTSEREERIINRLNELATLLNADFTKYETKNSRGEETTKYVITIAK